QTNVTGGAIGRHAIGAGQHRGGEIRHGGGVRAHVSAIVVEKFVIDCKNFAIFVDGGTDFVVLLARMIGRDQMFAPVLDPFYRTSECQRGRAHQNIFRIDFAAHAETAADVTLEQLNGFTFAPKHFRQRVAIPVRHFGGAVHFQYVVGFVVTHD